MRRSCGLSVRSLWLTSTTLLPRDSTNRVRALSHNHRRTSAAGTIAPLSVRPGSPPGCPCNAAVLIVTPTCTGILLRDPSALLSISFCRTRRRASCRRWVRLRGRVPPPARGSSRSSSSPLGPRGRCSLGVHDVAGVLVHGGGEAGLQQLAALVVQPPTQPP